MDRPELEKRTAAFASAAFQLCLRVRPRPGGFDPANQLQRASSSVAANYRASGRGRSPKEFVAKIGVVNEEADECVYWLEYIRDNKLASGDALTYLYGESCELRAIFSASHATARRNQERREQEKKKREQMKHKL